ncbi:MAG: hypothetical protein KAS30_01550 [Candidatus Diapherotrites archaeon]|nr:hypothetical protein [Candidatus Diapherotrites archaeon]
MAGIDVSELMTDPDFTDVVDLITRASSLAKGVNTLVETTISGVIMVVQPASGQDLEKVPESARGHETRNFYYSGTLSSLRQNGYSDIIVYGGNRFEVLFVEPWGNWGNGYTKGIATKKAIGNG